MWAKLARWLNITVGSEGPSLGSDLLRKKIRQVSIWMGNKYTPPYPIRVLAIHSQWGHESACGRGGGRKKIQECSRRQLALWPFRGNQAYPPKLLASLPHSVADKRPSLGWVSKEKEKRTSRSHFFANLSDLLSSVEHKKEIFWEMPELLFYTQQ